MINADCRAAEAADDGVDETCALAPEREIEALSSGGAAAGCLRETSGRVALSRATCLATVVVRAAARTTCGALSTGEDAMARRAPVEMDEVRAAVDALPVEVA